MPRGVLHVRWNQHIAKDLARNNIPDSAADIEQKGTTGTKSEIRSPFTPCTTHIMKVCVQCKFSGDSVRLQTRPRVCPQISQIGTDFGRVGRRLSSILKSVPICEICGQSPLCIDLGMPRWLRLRRAGIPFCSSQIGEVVLGHVAKESHSPAPSVPAHPPASARAATPTRRGCASGHSGSGRRGTGLRRPI